MKHIIEEIKKEIEYWQGQHDAFGIPTEPHKAGYNSYTANKDARFGQDCRLRIVNLNRELQRAISEHDPEPIDTAEAMTDYGGGFVKALAEAWFRGDNTNRITIQRSFEQVWDKYAKIAKAEATK